MSSIKSLIQSNNLTGTAAEIAAALNAASVDRAFDTPVGPALLYKMAGAQVAGGVSAVLKAAAEQSAFMADVQRAYCAYGLVLSDSDTRDQIDLIFTGDYAGLGTALKAIGRYQVSLCESAGLSAATEQGVQAALDEIANDATRQAASDAWDGVESLFSLTPTTTRQQAVVRFARTLLTTEQADAVQAALEG